MNLIILVGVWALAFGHITITNSLKMKGNDARLFGATLILVATYVMPHLTAFFNGYAPEFITSKATLVAAFDGLVGAFAIYATGWFSTDLLPKLRVPKVTISVKKARN